MREEERGGSALHPKSNDHEVMGERSFRKLIVQDAQISIRAIGSDFGGVTSLH
jgi:hypothetical protein